MWTKIKSRESRWNSDTPLLGMILTEGILEMMVKRAVIINSTDTNTKDNMIIKQMNSKIIKIKTTKSTKYQHK